MKKVVSIFVFVVYAWPGYSQAGDTIINPAVVVGETRHEGVITADSLEVQVHPSYGKPGKLHRVFFGENYRKEWSASTTLPVIRISEFQGGLIPLQLGGGFQSKSLRLKDKNGKEWIIRSVEKSPEALLPPEFRQTFAKDWVDDVTSAQHPFSALTVPPIANAVHVPHTHPVIGVLSPDKNLGSYSKTFNRLVVLLEEREPLGKSDNSEEMKEELQEDNDNRISADEFLRARMLDMLLGDWDRHEDQWRWYDESRGRTKTYLGVPRDRDQVFHVTQGIIPKIASREYILPTLRNFGASIRDPKWLLYKTRFVNAYPAFQISHEDWMKQAGEFQKLVTDSVLETALKRLPRSAYELRYHELFRKLKARRDQLPAAMDKYYRFIQHVVDIRASDKNEFIEIIGVESGKLLVRMHKLNRERQARDLLMSKIYDPVLTKEIRIYLGKGTDSVVFNNPSSPIKLRIIGGDSTKAYHAIASRHPVKIYEKENNARFSGNISVLKKRFSNDSIHTAYTEVNLYHIRIPLTTIGLNRDDGLILGTGFKFVRQRGFRKFPYASVHQVVVAHSFSTRAYRIRYSSEWTQALGKADIFIKADANAPHNTLNFFGIGNNTVFDKTGDYKTFYRTRFSTYQVNTGLRWQSRHTQSSLSAGPSLYYYSLELEENAGRFINNTSLVGSYDSANIDKNKVHLGIDVQWLSDKRNRKINPQHGIFTNIRLVAYEGLNKYARSYAQLIPEFVWYKNLDKAATVILANRVGGTLSIGHPAFYQSAFIGGHENLLGYRQYRFAGQHSVYNNFELRVKLVDIASYIAPGQFGMTGFWDIGRVWEKNDNSGKWHNGQGFGIYFAPASIVTISFVVGHSVEGWYPYFTIGTRF